MPKTSAVGPRPEPKSSAIASANGPNVYAVPKPVPEAMAAPAATRQARGVSKCAGIGGVVTSAGVSTIVRQSGRRAVLRVGERVLPPAFGRGG